MSYISATDEIMYAPLFFRFVTITLPQLDHTRSKGNLARFPE
jgi:hypothetical protein